jgi:AraC-like DNA-binding protein
MNTGLKHEVIKRKLIGMMKIKSLSKLRSKPKQLIENRISYASPKAMLSVYDTFEPCEAIGLDSEEITFCGMISGKKIVHTDDKTIDFTPQQSFVMSPGSHIDIDFPQASLTSPTTCITINIRREHVKEVCDHLNLRSKQRENEYLFNPQDHLHESLNIQTQSLLQRLIQLFSEPSDNQGALIELGISELVIRMLSQQSRNFILNQLLDDPEQTGLHKALFYIQHHYQTAIDSDILSKIACMSRSKFFAEFKRHLGCTPSEFIIQQRLKHSAKLLKAGKPVTLAAFDSGFSNMSHFSRRFLQNYGVTPTQFKKYHYQIQ